MQTRPEAQSTNVCPRLRMVGSAGSGRGQGPSSSNRSPTPRNPNVVKFPSLPRRTNTRDPVSHACDGQVGRVPRRSNAGHAAPKPPACKQHQPSHFLSGDNAVAYRLGSGVRRNLAHGEAVALTSPSIDFAPNVAPQVRPRRSAGLGGPRWLTPCSTKLLSVTCYAGARAIRRNMKRAQSSSPSTSWTVRY